jgi:hypothetical protein
VKHGDLRREAIMSSVIFKTKEGELFEVYQIDRKNRLVGGYRIFSGYCEPNPFRIFNVKDVVFATLKKGEPQEATLSMGGVA